MFKTNLLLNELDDNEFALLRDIVFKESGINLADRKKAMMQSRLIKRLRLLKINSYKKYYEYLINNYDDEIINFINCITTNKTDFFREPKHFEFIKNEALPELEKKRREIRIWSAGCSTGEEPYSIAITIAEYFRNKGMSAIPDVKILATDIDTNVLNTGIAGIYKEESLENINPQIKGRYFLRKKNDVNRQLVVSDSIKNMVHFKRLNLLDDVFPMRGKFDFIFCRNVIIYFDKKTRDLLIQKFHDYLDDDGYFFAGHSENLSNISNRYKLVGNTVYRKAERCT